MSAAEKLKAYLPTEQQLSQAKYRVKEGKEKFATLVKDHPIASVAVATGIGFVIGKFLTRKK